MTDLESFELGLERRLERYQRKYNLAHADLAWILLRVGTSYYFRDISSRRINGNGHDSPEAITSTTQRIL
ncbi:MAG: hypothetical protein HY665_09850 [Chloroflexi bacterium]|nr:hypothetical protein [Chloroflexota bacterium]